MLPAGKQVLPGYSPSNYTAASANLDGHLSGIDNALGGVASAQIPSDYVELPAPDTTISPTLVDIVGMSITVTLTTASHILGILTWDCDTTGGGTNAQAAFAVEINSVDGQEVERFLSGTNDMGTGASQFRTAAPVAAGIYTIKGRWRRVAGTRTLQCTHAQLSALGLQAAGGALVNTPIQSSGPYLASAGQRVRFTTAVGTIQLPPSPSADDLVAIKNVSADVTPITVDGNGNDVEAQGTYSMAATQSVAGDGIGLTYQYDGTNWSIV